MDGAGNVLFHAPEATPGDLARPVLLVGSHFDTVRHGGRFDGAYGAVAGLMLAAHRRGRPGLPVVGFATCEEEQSRFDSHMMGARSLLGLVDAAELDRVKDADGVTWRAALREMRASGHAAGLADGERPFTPAFRASHQLELHIEQGPVLESAGLELGIVEHIAGYRRIRATIDGAARHAGTTPLALRHDALAAAAELVLAVESLARDAGEPAIATCGNALVAPALYNVVPGHCEVWMEARHVEPRALDVLARAMEDRGRAIAARRGVAIAFESVTRQEPPALASGLAGAAEALARERAIRHRRMASGAAHDTMEFARAGSRTLMLFAPSRDGISHSPDEHTDTAALWRGLEFAGALIGRVADGAAARA